MLVKISNLKKIADFISAVFFIIKNDVVNRIGKKYIFLFEMSLIYTTYFMFIVVRSEGFYF